MKRERRLTIRIKEEDYRPARVKAAELGISISHVVRELLMMWAADEVELPLPEPEQEG